MSSGNSGPGGPTLVTVTGPPTKSMPIEQDTVNAASGPRPFVPVPPESVFKAVQLPSVEQLAEQVRNGAPSEPINPSPSPLSAVPPLQPMPSTQSPSPTVDTSDFLKAQAAFIEAQTQFLNFRNSQTDYTQEVTAYSHAQTALIQAQAELLKQFGVI